MAEAAAAQIIGRLDVWLEPVVWPLPQRSQHRVAQLAVAVALVVAVEVPADLVEQVLDLPQELQVWV